MTTARAYQWAGIDAGLTHRLRMAVVSSTSPTHQSSIVGATVASRFVPTLRLDATAPLDEVVTRLNVFRPDSLVGFARTALGKAPLVRHSEPAVASAQSH